jgi:hypothetical protein
MALPSAVFLVGATLISDTVDTPTNVHFKTQL